MSAPALILRRRGKVVARVRPGQRVLIGRAPAADVTLDHPSVSRLHARVAWPQGRARPVIEDLQSVNGVSLNGRRIAQRAELKDDMVVTLGSFELRADVIDDVAPALVDDGGTVRVRLFSEWGPELEGELRTPEELRDLLLDLEGQRRTGTLVLADHGQLTFARGRVVDATTPAARGLVAARALIGAPRPGRFRFLLDLTPRESDLDLSVRGLLEAARHATERRGRERRNVAS